MNDLISRQAALEMLNDNELERQADDVFDGYLHRYKRAAQRIIAQLPTIDAVSVVRCRECKNMYEDCGGTTCAYGAFVDCITPNDFYCAFGERSEE